MIKAFAIGLSAALLALTSIAAGNAQTAPNPFEEDQFPNKVRIYPQNPVEGETVYAVVRYPCIFPALGVTPRINRIENTVQLIPALLGNACFTQPFDQSSEYAYPIGSFYEGKYSVRVVHGFSFDNRIMDPERGSTPPLTLNFEVSAGISDTFSGTWNTDQVPGEIQITKLSDTTAKLSWITYDLVGNPLWLRGELQRDKNGELIGELYFDRGYTFNTPYIRPLQVTFGTISVQQTGCDRMRMRYSAVLPGYENGTFDFINTSRASGLRSCEPNDLHKYISE